MNSISLPKLIKKMLALFVVSSIVAVAGQLFINYLAESLREDLYYHIPNINVYESNMTLRETMVISTRKAHTAVASNAYPMRDKGDKILSYYERQLSAQGWEKGKGKNDRGYSANISNHVEYYFFKDNVSLKILFLYPMEDSPERFIYGVPEDYMYVMTFIEEKYV